MWNVLFNWLKRVFLPERPFKAEFIEEPPVVLKKKVIYIVGQDSYPWQMVMRCPCGCDSLLYMNLMKEDSPCWRFSLGRKNIISIQPSINRIVDCKSHFFVREGKILWA